jgi:hypothetical protein
MVIVIPILLLPPLTEPVGPGAAEEVQMQVPPSPAFGDARAGEENGIRASTAALCGHEHATGDERAPPGQRRGDGCP